MRHMQERAFCSVCQEGLWTNLLHRLVHFGFVDSADLQHLIEAINLTPVKGSKITMSLSLLGFGQLRPKPQKGERYRVSWTKNGVLATKYDDQVSITLPVNEATGVWQASVQLLTDEVRKDLDGVLHDSATFEVQ